MHSYEFVLSHHIWKHNKRELVPSVTMGGCQAFYYCWWEVKMRMADRTGRSWPRLFWQNRIVRSPEEPGKKGKVDKTIKFNTGWEKAVRRFMKMKGLCASQTRGTITTMNKGKGLPNGPISDHRTLPMLMLMCWIKFLVEKCDIQKKGKVSKL